MIEIIIAQILAIAYTEFSVRQEKPVVSMMIYYVPPTRLLGKEFHLFGWLMTVIFCAALSLAWWPLGIMSGLWYWLLFDLRIAKKLGTEAKTDRMLSKLFGKHALIIKSIVCAVILIALNVFLCLKK